MGEMETLGLLYIEEMTIKDMDERGRTQQCIINGEVTVPYGHQQF
jgi:hypothetical protein